jgi:hypothetical protein
MEAEMNKRARTNNAIALAVLAVIFLVVFAIICPRKSHSAVNPHIIENPVPKPIQWWAI